ncbi:transposon Ty3-I Gag-Pol polyprotein [Trichonephila clavipes]|nr:transposon Ty3-I Gag-Pol polyprotein [Trichonephila clavipes]
MDGSQISCAAFRALALNSREQLIREQREDPELGHIYRYLEIPDDGSVNATVWEVTKFPPVYLLFGTLPYTPPLVQNQVYPPVEEARRLAKENTIKYHEKNKIKYDARFIDSPFEPGDIVI